MGVELETLFATTFKIIAPLHHYNSAIAKRDVVIVVGKPYDSMYYIVVDNVNNDILYRKHITKLSELKKLIVAHNPSNLEQQLTMHKVFGLYYEPNVNQSYATIFCLFKNTVSGNTYLLQMNVDSHNTKNVQVLPITHHFEKSNVYLDVLIKENVTVNDYKAITDIDAFIVFIDTHNNNGKLPAANVAGTRVLVTEQEKAEFTLRTGIALPETEFPVVDVWKQVNHVFFKLTDDTVNIKFNFSTGVGFLGFAEEVQDGN